MQTQDNTEMCYWRETEILGEKTLHGLPSQNDSLVNKVKG